MLEIGRYIWVKQTNHLWLIDQLYSGNTSVEIHHAYVIYPKYNITPAPLFLFVNPWSTVRTRRYYCCYSVSKLSTCGRYKWCRYPMPINNHHWSPKGPMLHPLNVHKRSYTYCICVERQYACFAILLFPREIMNLARGCNSNRSSFFSV